MIKALIFDLDGTLANTEELHYRAWEKTLVGNGLPEFTFPTFLNYVGSSNEKLASDYACSYGIERDATELVLAKQANYMELIPEIELCAGVREILNRFHGEKLLAVASSSHQREVMAILELHGITGFFTQVLGGDMVQKKKPDPEIYLRMQALLQVSAQECVAFEDSSHGLNAAKSAGMFGIAIPNEFTRGHDFSRADRILDSFKEVGDTLLLGLVAGSESQD